MTVDLYGRIHSSLIKDASGILAYRSGQQRATGKSVKATNEPINPDDLYVLGARPKGLAGQDSTDSPTAVD